MYTNGGIEVDVHSFQSQPLRNIIIVAHSCGLYNCIHNWYHSFCTAPFLDSVKSSNRLDCVSSYRALKPATKAGWDLLPAFLFNEADLWPDGLRGMEGRSKRWGCCWVFSMTETSLNGDVLGGNGNGVSSRLTWTKNVFVVGSDRAG